MITPHQPPKPWAHPFALLLAALLIGTLLLAPRFVTAVPQQPTMRDSISQAQLSKGTEGMLKQTALHISKLQGGESIGGYPGFEPPDDDERYKNKIRNRTYSGEEANDWIKEINNYLKQIAKKNPDMTLEEILQRAGLNQTEIEQFLNGLRDVHYLAKSNARGGGVTSQSFQTLQALMEQLGVAPWAW